MAESEVEAGANFPVPDPLIGREKYLKWLAHFKVGHFPCCLSRSAATGY